MGIEIKVCKPSSSAIACASSMGIIPAISSVGTPSSPGGPENIQDIVSIEDDCKNI